MKKGFFWILLAVGVLGAGGLIIAQNNNGGYRGYGVSSAGLFARLSGNNGGMSAPVSYIQEHGICKKVTSSSSNTLFIPTQSSGEWTTFIQNKPSHVSLSECGCRQDSDCPGNDVCAGYAPAVTPGSAEIFGSCVTPVCGNGVREGSEQCDGGTQSCNKLGLEGTQSCTSSCRRGECSVSACKPSSSSMDCAGCESPWTVGARTIYSCSKHGKEYCERVCKYNGNTEVCQSQEGYCN